MREPNRFRIWVPLAALSIVLLAACGGGGSTAAASSPDDSANTTSASADGAPADMQKFLDCMKEQGVELPDGGRFQQGAGGEAPPGTFQLGQGQPGQGQPGQGQQGQAGNGSPPASFDSSKLQAAQEACGDLLPEGANFGGPGGFGGANGGGVDTSAFDAYRSCMSDHGVTIPERQDNQPAQPPASIDRNSDSFKAANDVCASLLPNGGQGSVTQGTNP